MFPLGLGGESLAGATLEAHCDDATEAPFREAHSGALCAAAGNFTWTRVIHTCSMASW